MDSKLRILIAEDDVEDRFMMSETFDELGYTNMLEFITDGTMLMRHLDASADNSNIGLIILDLNMPRLNGTETLRLLKNEPQYRNIPVIIFSTSINEIEKAMCMELGARDYVTKPAKYVEYIETCKKFHEIATEAAIS